jgi:hypothetical protein
MTLYLRMLDSSNAAIDIRECEERDMDGILAINNEVLLTSTAIYRDEPATLDDRREWWMSRVALLPCWSRVMPSLSRASHPSGTFERGPTGIRWSTPCT